MVAIFPTLWNVIFIKSFHILTKMQLMLVPYVPIDDKSALVQVTA